MTSERIAVILDDIRDDPTEAALELAAYRDGLGQIAWDLPAPGQPVHTFDGGGDPVDYLQYTYRGEPAWICQCCNRVMLAAEAPDVCVGCGAVDAVGEMLRAEPVQCRVVGGYDGPCLVGGLDGCHCHETTT